ncbi:MAG: hypothetical protein LBL80_05130 [Ruminococcus sp.]|nr:hypothetical protein [Ruminococcus sp.]
MKKEDLIKKAAERGITIDETQADKYISLSDEELANLDIAGGKCARYNSNYGLTVYGEEADGCPYFEFKGSSSEISCFHCANADKYENTPGYRECILCYSLSAVQHILDYRQTPEYLARYYNSTEPIEKV